MDSKKSAPGNDAPPALRHWNLGQRRSIPAANLMAGSTGRTRAMDEFMLMISLAFNDLKDVFWILARMNESVGLYPSMSPEWGQVQGFQVHAQRQVVGIMHEILKAIETQKKVVTSREFGLIESKMPSGPKGSWDQIVIAAGVRTAEHVDEGVLREFRQWLTIIRNKAVFHYGDPKMMGKGFRLAFSGGQGRPETANAFFTDGNNMEATRFFYADAAAQEVLRLNNESAESDIGQNAQAFNIALKHLIIAYLETRTDV